MVGKMVSDVKGKKMLKEQSFTHSHGGGMQKKI